MDRFWFLSITNFMQKLNFQNERPLQVVFTDIKTFNLLFDAIYPFTIKNEHIRGPL